MPCEELSVDVIQGQPLEATSITIVTVGCGRGAGGDGTTGPERRAKIWQ